MICMAAFAQAQSGETGSDKSGDIDSFLQLFTAKWTAFSGKLGPDTILYQIGRNHSWALEWKTFGTSATLDFQSSGWYTGIPKVSRDGSRFYFEASYSTGPRYIIEAAPGSMPRLAAALPYQSGLFDVSPDGREIVYQMRPSGGGLHQLFRVDLATSKTVQFTDPQTGGLLAAYSPDGKQIAYVASKKLRVREIATGRERIIVDDAALKELPAWSPDGKWIVYQGSLDPIYSYDIYKANVETSGAIRLTQVLGMDINPSFTKDGRHILFASQRGGNRQPALFAMTADGKYVQKDETGDSMIYLPVTSGNLSLTAPQLAEISPPETAIAEATPVPPPGFASPDIAPPPAPVAAGVRTIQAFLAELTQNQEGIHKALDSKHIIYAVHSDRGFELKAKSFNWNDSLLVARLGDIQPSFDLLSDRSTLVIKFLDRSTMQNWLVKLGPWGPPSLLANLPADPELDFDRFDISPDGKEMLFEVRIDEMSHIYVYKIGTGETRLVTAPDTGGVFPAWAPDGQSFAYIAAGQLRVKNAQTGAEKTLVGDSSLKQWPSWSSSGQILYEAKGDGEEGFDIYSVNVPSGERKRLTDAPKDDTSPCFSGDGLKILFASERETGRAKAVLYRMAPDGASPERDAAPEPGIVRAVW